MTKQREQPPYSYAHRVALGYVERYRAGAKRAMVANAVTHFVLLAVSAATIVAAATRVAPVVTASLAAASFLLTGARSYFDWNSLAVTRTNAREDIQAHIDHYMATPAQERSQAKLNIALVDDVHEVSRSERALWSSRRRRLSSGVEGETSPGSDSV